MSHAVSAQQNYRAISEAALACTSMNSRVEKPTNEPGRGTASGYLEVLSVRVNFPLLFDYTDALLA